jgi:DNA polymerase-3 subunit gamma/tau
MAKSESSPSTSDVPTPAENARDDATDVRDNRYVVVARRYRPRSFDQLVGQQHVGQALCNAIETGRVGHAYLFTGARGVGKTSTARIFAKALNDPGGPTATPDGSSDVAQAIDAGEDVDVLEIDGASNRGIDEIRSLRAGVGVRPSRSRYKIYIIDEVHMLTNAAFNALLKTLEEPPAHVKFIFCTTDPEKIPITVLSRCQRFDFAPVQTESILGRLREIVDSEGVKADEEALRLIARRADGSMRDSQSLLEQVMSFSSGELTTQTVHSMLGTADDARLHDLGKALAAGDAMATLQQIDRACGQGVAAGQLAEQMLGYFRDLMLATVGCPAEMQRHTGESLHGELKSLGQQWGLQTVLAILGMVDHALVRIRHSLHGRVLLESTLVQVCHLPNLQAVSDLAASLGGGKPLVGGRPASPDQKKKLEPVTATVSAAELPRNPQSAVHSVSPGTHTPDDDKIAIAHPTHAVRPPAATATAAQSAPPTNGSAASSVSQTRPPGAFPSAAQPAPARPTPAQPARPADAPVARFDPGGGSQPGFKPAASSTNPGGANSAARTAVAAKSRAQMMREVELDPYVQNCLEIFGGEIVRIDPPRPIIADPAPTVRPDQRQEAGA